MIFYTDGYRNNMVSIDPVNSLYHNNRNWAIANKTKGLNATACAVGSTTVGCIKTFTDKDSISNKLLNFIQKVLAGFRNSELYSVYKREDDDLAFDKEKRPLASNIGVIACEYETKVNPIALPISAVLNENVSEGYSSISNWFNSMWWRLRLCSEKINWQKLKEIPANIKLLFDNDFIKRRKALLDVKDIVSPVLGLFGAFFTGLFVPIRAWNKLKGMDNKLIEACADSGTLSQHLAYLFRFTLDELQKAQITNNKNSWFLFGSGLAANMMNIGLPLIDILPLNERSKTLYRELAQGLARIFFSARRNVKGREWLKND